jgi:hypothetical protein
MVVLPYQYSPAGGVLTDAHLASFCAFFAILFGSEAKIGYYRINSNLPIRPQAATQGGDPA